MKKTEAEQIAPDKSKIIIEYINQILSDPNKVTAKISFDATKIEGQHMCIVDIYVSENKFERHLNMGITSQQCNVFYKQFLSDLLSVYIKSENKMISRFISIYPTFSECFCGIEYGNKNGSKIEINFKYFLTGFSEIVEQYENVINDIEKTNNQEENRQTKKSHI